MKKTIAFFAFLCLALGSTGAKGLLDNPEGSSAQIEIKKLEYAIPYIPVEQRAAILPKHNICSIAPRENLRTISSPATVSCASRLPASPTTR